MRNSMKEGLYAGTLVAKMGAYVCLGAIVSPYLFYASVRDVIDNHELDSMKGRTGKFHDALERLLKL